MTTHLFVSSTYDATVFSTAPLAMAAAAWLAAVFQSGAAPATHRAAAALITVPTHARTHARTRARDDRQTDRQTAEKVSQPAHHLLS
eukprot:SAG25_NODE_1919_length_2145_cov_23.367546_1_plen_87_part_00